MEFSSRWASSFCAEIVGLYICNFKNSILPRFVVLAEYCGTGLFLVELFNSIFRISPVGVGQFGYFSA